MKKNHCVQRLHSKPEGHCNFPDHGHKLGILSDVDRRSPTKGKVFREIIRWVYRVLSKRNIKSKGLGMGSRKRNSTVWMLPRLRAWHQHAPSLTNRAFLRQWASQAVWRRNSYESSGCRPHDRIGLGIWSRVPPPRIQSFPVIFRRF